MTTDGCRDEEEDVDDVSVVLPVPPRATRRALPPALALTARGVLRWALLDGEDGARWTMAWWWMAAEQSTVTLPYVKTSTVGRRQDMRVINYANIESESCSYKVWRLAM